MSNAAFRKLFIEWDANYKYNNKFKEYVDKNYKHSIDMYGEKSFDLKDMKTACKFWKQECKKDKNKIWFSDFYDVEIYLNSIPVGVFVD